MKLPKNLIFPAQQLPLERDGVQPYPSKSSSWGSVACLRSPFYCPSLSLGLSSPLVEVFVLSDKHWAKPYVSWVALCNIGGWVTSYSSTCESFPLWPHLKGGCWITLHFISDWHWMPKIYFQCRHRFYSAEGIIFPEISRSTWACQCQFLLYKQLRDPKAEFTVLFPCKCQM